MSNPKFAKQPDEQTEGDSLQIDLFGIKARLRPTDLNEPEPRTWREVIGNINTHLQRFVNHTFGLAADVPQGMRRLIKRLSRSSTEKDRIIGNAHERTDRIEDIRSEKIENHQLPVPNLNQSSDFLQNLISKLLAEGKIEIVRLETGEFFINAVKPEDRELSIQSGREILKELPGLKLDDLMRTSVDKLKLSIRSSDCLARAKIKTIGELIDKTEADLLAIRSFGKTSLREVKAKLDYMGLSLKEK